MAKISRRPVVEKDPLKSYFQGIAEGIRIARLPSSTNTEALFRNMCAVARARTSSPSLQSSRGRGRPKGSASNLSSEEMRKIFVWVWRRTAEGMTVNAACKWLAEQGAPYSRATLVRRFNEMAALAVAQQRNGGGEFVELVQQVAFLVSCELAIKRGEFDANPEVRSLIDQRLAEMPKDPSRRRKGASRNS